MNENLTWEKKDKAVVFRFHGSIESDITSMLRRQIIQILKEEKSDTAVFHLGDATYIDSMGIGMFVHLHVQHHEKIQFLFCEMSTGISKAFGSVKLISFFDIRDSLDEVLEELRRAEA
ncbi:MAG: STAS domain-containing protein [Spirochaetaceae bacterium]|nr:STAS domain-containing protein [Spirochaetaceae bacterium]